MTVTLGNYTLWFRFLKETIYTLWLTLPVICMDVSGVKMTALTHQFTIHAKLLTKSTGGFRPAWYNTAWILISLSFSHTRTQKLKKKLPVSIAVGKHPAVSAFYSSFLYICMAFGLEMPFLCSCLQRHQNAQYNGALGVGGDFRCVKGWRQDAYIHTIHLF